MRTKAASFSISDGDALRRADLERRVCLGAAALPDASLEPFMLRQRRPLGMKQARPCDRQSTLGVKPERRRGIRAAADRSLATLGMTPSARPPHAFPTCSFSLARADARPSTPEALAAVLDREDKVIVPLIRKLGIKAE